MESFKLDVVRKTLTITEKYSKKLQDMESAEFKHYTALMTAIPGLTVVHKTHKTPSKYITKSGEQCNCNQFKNLTYANMEQFIDSLPDAKHYRDEYDFIKNHASSIQTNKYALVRRWFMAQFPHFRKNPLFYIYNTPALIHAADIMKGTEAEKEIKQAS